MTTSIGIEVDGEHVRGGIVRLENGDVLCHRESEISANHRGPALLADVIDMAEALYDEGCGEGMQPSTIGLCLCEDVDEVGGIATGRRVPWRGLPVRHLLAQIAPARVDTSVRAYARVEARFGAGHGSPSFVYAHLASGLQACLVLSGEPHVGNDGRAVLDGSLPCSMFDVRGRRIQVVLDEVASASAVVHRAHTKTLSEAVAAAERGGDFVVQEVLSAAGEAAGAALGWLCNAVAPHALVVGGELVRTSALYWTALCAMVVAVVRSDDGRLPIRQAIFGEHAGMIGAALGAGELSSSD